MIFFVNIKSRITLGYQISNIKLITAFSLKNITGNGAFAEHFVLICNIVVSYFVLLMGFKFINQIIFRIF